MATGDTDIRICSDSLLMLGANPISSFTEGTDEANICDRLYPDIKIKTLASYPWSFSFKKVQLARLITTPTNEYKYQYQMPSDMIGVPRAVYDTASVGGPIRKEYRLMGDKILTDYEQVYVDYQYNVPEYALPHYFVQLLKYQMAWHLAMPITDQNEKSQYWQVVAQGTPGENGRGGYMRQAMSIDGQGQPTNAFQDFSLIDVRY
ncbi:tail tubular protein A [Methylophilales phage MEP301]|nr:tail tubular protein A [Methylophilales phage MEP301]